MYSVVFTHYFIDVSKTITTITVSTTPSENEIISSSYSKSFSLCTSLTDN